MTSKMRSISFSLTTPQFLDGSKDVTRRLGWLFLKPGSQLCAVEKAMGLKKGERHRVLGIIEVVDVSRVVLKDIDQDDCRREGFPDMAPADFVEFFCKGHVGCGPESTVTRIEFRRI